MRIILIGASGTIGKAIHAELGERHEVLPAGRNSGDLRVDLSDRTSIQRLFQQTGEFDALVNAAGSTHFGPLEEMTEAQLELGLRNKLMGQVNLVLVGLKYARDRGSFTLTTGLLSDDPIRLGASASLVNGAVDSFVRSAALELPRGLRINSVSPTIIEESLPKYAAFFRGYKAVPAREAALGYAKSVEGAQTGQVYRVGWARPA
jgi:NAD(P)-dependent dehydrogenase (short-subunit alcohol dehydrogenase family)